MRWVKNDRPLTTTHEILGKLETEVEVIRFDSDEEAATFYGGRDQLLELINSATATSQMNEGRITLRDYEVPKEAAPTDYDRLRNEAKEAARKTVKDYSGTRSVRGPSVKKRVEGQKIAEKIVTSGLDFNRDEMVAALQGTIPDRFKHLFND